MFLYRFVFREHCDEKIRVLKNLRIVDYGQWYSAA